MDGNNWRAAQGQVQMPGQVISGESVPPGGMEGGDWRTQLQQDSRQRIVNKIMETLKRHLPFSGQEGLQELKKIAVKFEEKIYTAATSQSDYLRKISLKMLTMETKSQNPMANSLQPNAASNSKNPQDPDSLSQTGSATAGDWQEEIYQKIKSMHEMYYPELNEMYQRMAAKLQQHDAHPQQPRNEQLEKLRFLKLMLERLIMFLRTNKNDIQPNHKDKIGGVEKQIVNILNSNRPRKAVPSMQQGQLPQPHMHAVQQSQQQQPQMHSSEGQINSQMQPMNMQGSMMPTQQNSLAQQNNLTQQNNLNNLQHSTLSSGSSVSNFRQNMLNGLSNSNMLQPNSSILNPQYQQLQYQQLRLQQQMQGQQLLQQQQVIKQLMLQLQQQQTSLMQKVTQLHVQPMQQPLQQKQPQLQPLQSHLMQPELFLLKQQQFQRLTRQPLVVQPPQQQILNQQHLKQKLPQETSQNQPELTPENLWDVEKQPLIPKQKTSQKQRSGQKTLPRLKTASLILVVSAVLLLVLVMMLLGVVLGTNQLYWG